MSRFNDFITNRLLDGAKDTLVRHGVDEDNIDVAYVPGAFEIPLVAKKLAQKNDYDAVITLGCVIRGATSHYDYVCNEVAKGVSKANDVTNTPFSLDTKGNKCPGLWKLSGLESGLINAFAVAVRSNALIPVVVEI